MGTSVVNFGPYGFWLNDSHFKLLLHLLADEVDHSTTPFDWLLSKRDQWRSESISGVIGCHNAHLDGLDSAPLVASLAEKVYQRVAARNEPLSEERGSRVPDGGRPTFVGDIPKEWFFQGLEAFIKLLRGELRVTPETFPVLPIIPICEMWRPEDPEMVRMNHLWIELERAHFSVASGRSILDRVLTKMWESADPSIQAAWKKLTLPEHLPALERWKTESPFQLSVPLRKSPQQGLSLQDACEEALRQCRSRQS